MDQKTTDAHIERVKRDGFTIVDNAIAASLVDALNADHLDWLFSRAVVADALIALQANWMADYRNGAGFELAEGEYGTTLTIEDSSRVDPWIVSQAQRTAAACREALREFSRRDRVTSDG